MVLDGPIYYMSLNSFSFISPSVWIFFLTSSCGWISLITHWFYAYYWANNKGNKEKKNGLHTKENFWHAIFVLMLIMFYSKIIHITGKNGWPYWIVGIVILCNIFMTKYTRVYLLKVNESWRILHRDKCSEGVCLKQTFLVFQNFDE